MYEAVVVVVIVGALAVTATALIWSIAGNVRQGEAYRRRLAERLNRLRLGKALRLFGIDTERYVHGQRVVDIGQHMRRCGDCEDTDRCDAVLEDARTSDAIDFCPNHESLSTIRDAPASRGEGPPA